MPLADQVSPWGECAVIICIKQGTSHKTSANWSKQTSVHQCIFVSKDKKPVTNLNSCNIRMQAHTEKSFCGCKLSKYKAMHSTSETTHLARRRQANKWHILVAIQVGNIINMRASTKESNRRSGGRRSASWSVLLLQGRMNGKSKYWWTNISTVGSIMTTVKSKFPAQYPSWKKMTSWRPFLFQGHVWQSVMKHVLSVIEMRFYYATPHRKGSALWT